MSCRQVVREPADLYLLGIHQPADAILWRVLVNKWAILVWHRWSLTFICSNQQVGCVWNIELMAPLWVRLTAIATVMTIGVAVSWWTCNPMLGLCRG